jgi:hypothetical protein
MQGPEESLIQVLVDAEQNNTLVGKSCIIKPEVLEKYRADGCEPHADLCTGILTIIATQKGYGGKLIVRVQNDRIKKLHTGYGDLLNSFPKSLDEIELL